jgi:ABC-type Fe3+/spermidine/putrescine transport system ATPase subunit
LADAAKALAVRRLEKAFGGEGGVRGVDFDLAPSEVVSLLGPSGCGKTTTLRCIAGFYKPDQGTIHIGGTLVAGPGVFVPPEERQLAMVFQNYVLWPHMTAFDNVAYGLKLRRVPRSEIAQRVDEIMALMGLTGLARRYPHELSGGQQQRVSVARSLVVRPKVLLLDEPFSNLDAKLRIDMRQEMRDLLRRLSISAVYVTHDQEEAMVISHRILLMDTGRIVEEGTPFELFERPRTQFTASFFGVANLVAGVVRRRDGGLVLELDALGASVPLNGADGRDGERRVLGLRHDEIEVRPGNSMQPGWIKGQIVSRCYIGRAVEMEVRSGDRTFRCRVDDARAVDWPADVALRIVADRAVLLPHE